MKIQRVVTLPLGTKIKFGSPVFKYFGIVLLSWASSAKMSNTLLPFSNLLSKALFRHRTSVELNAIDNNNRQVS